MLNSFLAADDSSRRIFQIPWLLKWDRSVHNWLKCRRTYNVIIDGFLTTEPEANWLEFFPIFDGLETIIIAATALIFPIK